MFDEHVQYISIYPCMSFLFFIIFGVTQDVLLLNDITIYLGLSPLPVIVEMKVYRDSLYTKNGIILVVTVTGRGDGPKYI